MNRGWDKMLRQRAKVESCAIPADFEERVDHMLQNLPEREIRKKVRRVNMLLVAAVVCILLTVTAAACAMGGFEFLKGRSEHAYLGMNEIYETYAQTVGVSATAENGNVVTVDRVAMDGKFCTIFYSVRFREPLMTEEQLKQLQKDNQDGWFTATEYLPGFYLYAGDEEISFDGYQNSFEPQVYFADEYTVYGAWRFLLRRPAEEGETLSLRGGYYERDENNEWQLGWDFALDFAAHPISGEHFDSDVTFTAVLQGQDVRVEVLSLDRSPLGNLLTLRQEQMGSASLGVDFALRDADTGKYIPYAEVNVNHYWDPEGYTDNVYELFGDVSDLKNLELIPTTGIGGVSPQKAVPLTDLPCMDSGNQDGGYAPASYSAKNGQLIVEMQPVGAVNGWYARLGNGVYFLDAQGNQLFEDVWVEKYKDRSDGTITVVMTPSAESYARDVDKVAQVQFFVQQYEVLEGKTVSIPLIAS